MERPLVVRMTNISSSIAGHPTMMREGRHAKRMITGHMQQGIINLMEDDRRPQQTMGV